MLKHRRHSCSGQATAELLPSLVIFFMLLTAALGYYRALRDASIKQEVVRNLVMAKLNNSGTMTTTPNQIGAGGGTTPSNLNLSTEANRGPASFTVRNTNNSFMSSAQDCFSVVPDEGLATLPLGKMLIGGDLGNISFGTYAVLYRNSRGATCP